MSSAVVVDASAAVELLLRTEAGEKVGAALRDSQTAVPAHFDAEVLSALGRAVRAGHLAETAMPLILEELAAAPFDRYALQPLLAPAWALRHNLALRDALYVTLARSLGATVLTTDARLSRSPSLSVPVTLIATSR